MKKFCLVTVALMALCASSFPVYSQNRVPFLPYGYGSALEMQLGWAGSPYVVTGQSRKSVGLANGIDFTLRYTYYIGRSAGIFCSLSGGASGADMRHYFKNVNRADGDRYVYNPNSFGNYSSSYYLPVFLIGPAFRYDWNAWSLRPRLGIGVGRIVFNNDYYTFNHRDGTGLAGATLRELSTGGREYLAEEDYRYGVPGAVTSFSLGASLQLAYTLRQHCYIYFEAGVTAHLSDVTRCTSYYGVMDAYNPGNWAEAVYDSDKIGMQTVDGEHSARNREDGIAGLNITASAGIGWNIGWNRNENGWYRRRR